ncbi:MAG: glycosyltransferase [Mycoplasmataceae bacterium]|nr:glycosyltransferase [Mycoplasmataceae bacterium]
MSLTTIVVAILPSFGVFIFKQNNTFWVNNAMLTSIFAIFTICFSLIFNYFSNNHLRNYFVNECLEIVSNTQMPKQLPKVVYVYTTHDDFLPTRLLQNMQQTYENFEVWIADGSTHDDVRKETVEFAKKYNIHICQMPKTGSQSKAHNLNYFLKHSGAVFDYLLIADSDEIFDKNFVKCNIRFFYSKIGDRLAYITPLNQTYKSKGLFTNFARSSDDLGLFNRFLKHNYSFSNFPHLMGCSSLINANFLKTINFSFPNEVSEDIWTENSAVRNNWFSLYSPLNVCIQEFDKNIKSFQKRTSRIYDSIIKMDKNNPFYNFNDHYIMWFGSYFISVFVLIIFVLGIALLIPLIWLIIHFWNDILSAVMLWYFVGIVLGLLLLTFTLLSSNNSKILGFKRSIVAPFFIVINMVATIPMFLKHWFTATILSKYADFSTGSNTRHFGKVKKHKIPWKNILWFFLTTIPLVIVDVLFPYYGLLNPNNWELWVFITINVFFGILWISFACNLIGDILSVIPHNSKYNKDEFIYYKNDFVNFKKIKDNFYSENKQFERLC